jgi:phosphoribosylaminoimidazole-succinocarboxamide synthase
VKKKALTEIKIPGIPVFYSGKIRETFWASPELGYLIMISTDRISAFDSLLPTGIPDKGRVLNQLSAFWMNLPSIKEVVPNHLVSSDDQTCLAYLGLLPSEQIVDLKGRMMLVRKAERIDIECVVRGYLAGSAWAEYKESGTVSGQTLPKGLREGEELPLTMFTPTTKATEGHDQLMSLEEMRTMMGESITQELMEKSLAIYQCARNYAWDRGIIIADTKFEYGLIGDKLTLIDELLTPDSSRFWDRTTYKPGRAQSSFDKQPVRDWLIKEAKWNKEPPAPPLPLEVVEATTERYKEAYQRLTGASL